MGLHKTGTTAVQTALAAAAGRLRERHLLYPKAGRPADFDGHHNVAWQLAGDHRFRPAFGTVNDVAAEIASFPGDAVLSSEDFETVLGSPERLRLLVCHPALHDREIVSLIYVRDQVAYAESLFAEMLKYGIEQDAARFCDDVLAHGELRFRNWVFHFDYNFLRKRIMSAGVERSIVRPHSALVGGSTVADLLHVAGHSAEEVIEVAQQRANERDSPIQSLAQFCARRLGRNTDVIERRLDDLLINRMAQRRVHLSSDRRRAFQRRFARSNKRLARSCGFSPAALDAAGDTPMGSLDMENLFSARTARMVEDWVNGRMKDQQAAASLIVALGASD